MKRLSFWLTAGVVLFSFVGGSAKPTKAQLDSLEAVMPPPFPPYDEIKYDAVEQFGGEAFFNLTNYWIAQRFVPSFDFTLKAVYFQVDNSLINYKDSCFIRVVADSGGRPNTNSIILQDTFPAPLPSNKLWPFIVSDTNKQFARNVPFWILLGPVPGGPHPDDTTADIGDGWWMVHDLDTLGSDTGSFISLNGTANWILIPFDWVLRAAGDLAQSSGVKINEVMFAADVSSSDPSRNHEWVELYNSAELQQQQSLEGWSLTDGIGGANHSVPLDEDTVIVMPAGSFLVVHFADDTLLNDFNFSDSVGHVYVGKRGFFDDRKDACAILRPPFLGEGEQPVSQDIIGWKLKTLSIDSDTFPTPQEIVPPFSERVGRTAPPGGIGPLLTATAGISIGRDSLGTDTTTTTVLQDRGPDVALLGGRDAAGPTMGRKNSLPMVVDTATTPNQAPNAAWTVMLYFAADNGEGANSQERWCYDLLNQIERVLPDTAESVNVVVLFDSRRAYPKGNPIDTGRVFRGVLRHDLTDIVRNLFPLVGEQNTGDPLLLADSLIRWAKNNYPARHYVLALKGDGAGWQGLCGDANPPDRLEMGELKSAFSRAGLDTAKLDLLLFDAPLMSQLEVAYQVRNFAHFMVASPEMTGPADFDYGRMVEKLKKEGGTAPAIDSLALARFSVNTILRGRLANDLFAVWVTIQLDNLDVILNPLKTLAQNLKMGMEERCTYASAADNFQSYVRRHLTSPSADHYGKQAQGMADFIDLKAFSRILRGVAPSCANALPFRGGANEVNNALPLPHQGENQGDVVLTWSYANTDAVHFASAGLSIYFPSSRQRATPVDSARKKSPMYSPAGFAIPTIDHPFDHPGLATEGGVFDVLRMYARDTSACYPHPGGTCAGDTMAQYYPLLAAVRDFDFVNSTQWDEFLIRYYKPVADAGPEQMPGNLNVPVTLDASGSSDADDPLSSLSYFWDLFSTVDNPDSCDSSTKEDLDKNCLDDFMDDRDRTEKTIQFSFSNTGKQKVWLHVWDAYDSSLSGTERGYHTAKDSLEVVIDYQGVHLALEATNLSSIHNLYDNALERLEIINHCHTPLPTAIDRNNIPIDKLSNDVNTCPTIIWITAAESTTVFPPACQQALDSALNTDEMGVWVCAPLAGKDTAAANYFQRKLGSGGSNVVIDSTRDSARYLRPAGGSHFLSGLDTLELDTTSEVPLLQSVKRDTACPTFPILVADNGDTVAVARVLEPNRHAIIYSTFGLEHLADTNDVGALLGRVMSWLANPEAPNTCRFARIKGDLNGDGVVAPSDVVCMLECALDPPPPPGPCSCDPAVADMNCDGVVNPPDVTLLLLKAFNGQEGPC